MKKKIKELERNGKRRLIAYTAAVNDDVSFYTVYDYDQQCYIDGVWNQEKGDYDEEKHPRYPVKA